MIPNRNRDRVSTAEQHPLPQLHVAANRLRRLAVARGDVLDSDDGRKLIDEVLSAAADAEQALITQKARIRHLEGLSITDELTGLMNRRGFQVELSRALSRSQRRGETGLLLLCDLDHFKAINDVHGHLAGDAVLSTVAGVLSSNTRRSDYVARLGGDEFAVLMTHIGRSQAEHQVGKLKVLVNATVAKWDNQKIPVSASFGFEVYDRQSKPNALMYVADRALYKHKKPRLIGGTGS